MLINAGEYSDGGTRCQLQRLIAGVDTSYDYITLGTWPVDAVCEHHLVTQALNQSFWSMIV